MSGGCTLTKEHSVGFFAALKSVVREWVTGRIDGSSAERFMGDLELEAGEFGDSLEHSDSFSSDFGA